MNLDQINNALGCNLRGRVTAALEALATTKDEDCTTMDWANAINDAEQELGALLEFIDGLELKA
jgi:hypothetical protein